jgi:hypothetical protein
MAVSKKCPKGASQEQRKNLTFRLLKLVRCSQRLGFAPLSSLREKQPPNRAIGGNAIYACSRKVDLCARENHASPLQKAT